MYNLIWNKKTEHGMKEVGKKKVLSVLVTVLCGFIIQTNIITLYGRNKQTKAKQCVRC